MGLQIDSADYLPAFERALELADYDQYRKEQAARRESGEVKQIGIGLSSYIEMSGLAPSNILGALRYAAGGWEAAQVRCQPSGKVTLNIGTSPHGQGHDTVWSQIAADELGVHPDDVEVVHGDTSISPLGMDTYGSRSISIGGAALVVALQKIKDKARTLAAHELEVAEDDLEFRDGAFRVQGAPDKVRRSPSWPCRPGRRTTCPTATSPTSPRSRPGTRRTSPGRSAPTSASPRSTPRRERPSCSATWRSTTAGS
jgi:carbon-monoxide dehydrogenase large subunit